MRILKYISIDDDATVKSVLNKHFNLTSSVVSVLKNTKGILVNDEIVTVRKVMNRGDELKLIIPDTKSDKIEPVEGDLDILYEDEDILCVTKPSDMPTHPSQSHHTDTLANRVCYYYRNVPFTFRVSNRLDRYTSGVVIIAKNLYSASYLCTSEFRKTIKKTYYAVCRGIFDNKKGVITAPIARCDGSTIKRHVSTDGKYAETHFEVVSESDKLSLVKVMPKTGRTHQIRVHMAYIGHPLVNDFLYDYNCNENYNFLLHCSEISFIHPITLKKIKVCSPLPKEYNIY